MISGNDRTAGISRIREYRPNDREAVLALHAEALAHERALRGQGAPPAPPPPDEVARYHDKMAAAGPQSRFLLAEESMNGIVGYVFCTAEPSRFDRPGEQIFVQDMMVTRAARTRGIGKLLMAAVEAFAFEACSGRINLMVLANNAGAIRFYQNAGFAPAVHYMERDLGPELAPPPAKASGSR